MKSSTDPHSERRSPKKDVLHVLFKHRWKILLTSFLVSGAIAGAATEDLPDPTFTSHAKLQIRYVVERQDEPDDPSKKTNVPKAGSVMKTEMAILKSHDLAREVAKAIGPERLLSDPAVDDPEVRAAERIASGLEVAVRPGSNVIDLSYQDSSPELAPEVLETLIQKYFRKHIEIHRPSDDGFKVITTRVDQLRRTLQETEEEISRLKQQADTIRDEGGKLQELARRRQIEEASYCHLQASLQRAKVDAALDPAGKPKLSIIQRPTTPPRPDGR